MDKPKIFREFTARVISPKSQNARPTTLTSVQAGRPSTAPKPPQVAAPHAPADAAPPPADVAAGELGGPSGPEPTRYGDWERNGRCSDF